MKRSDVDTVRRESLISKKDLKTFFDIATMNNFGKKASASSLNKCVSDAHGCVLSPQVTSLHKGLDRCAALLSGILQAEKAGQVNFLTYCHGNE